MANLSRLRELSKNYQRWNKLEKWIDRIELVYDSDLESAVSNSNSLLETIFKTILAERVTQYRENEKLLKDIKLSPLVTQTLKNINLVNSDENSRFITAIATAIQNLGEIRNSFSHGKNLASYKELSPENLTASFLISSVENISCFLIEFYEIEHPRKKGEDEFNFQEMKEFNDYLDDQHGNVEIANITYSTSEALFAVDKTAYKGAYREYLEVINEQTN
jgi:hypothetical protein